LYLEGMLLYSVWALLLFGVLGYALWLGAWEERWTAVALIVIGLGSGPLLDQKHATTPQLIEWPAALADLVLLSILTYFAVVRRLWWAVWAAGFQSLSILIHASKLLDRDLLRPAYIAAYTKYGYLVVAAVAVGIWSRRPRRDLSPP